MKFREFQNQVVKQEATIKLNEKIIQQYQNDLNKLRGIKITEYNQYDENEFTKFEEKRKAHEDEIKKKEEARALQEEAEEAERRRILLAKKNNRQIVSFSMFGGI